MADTRFSTERLQITSACPSDAEAIARYYRTNVEHLRPWEPTRPPHFIQTPYWQARLTLQATASRNDDSFFYLWRAKDHPGPIVGTGRLSLIMRGSYCACTLGYNIGQEFEGRGYMTEALTRVIDHAFNGLHLHRIQANHLPTNERSARLLRRLGFVVEGYARDYLFIDGRWRDHVLTALTHPDPTMVPTTARVP